MLHPVHFLFGGHAAIYTCLPCHFKSQRLLCLCANFDRSSRYMYFWNLIGFRRFFDIYISLLCSPWLPGHLCLSAASFILWAFSLEFSYMHGLSVPTSHTMSWIECLELDQMYTGCWLLGSKSLTGLLACTYYYFEVLLGELWWFLYIYN